MVIRDDIGPVILGKEVISSDYPPVLQPFFDDLPFHFNSLIVWRFPELIDPLALDIRDNVMIMPSVPI